MRVQQHNPSLAFLSLSSWTRALAPLGGWMFFQMLVLLETSSDAHLADGSHSCKLTAEKCRYAEIIILIQIP